MLKTEMLKEVRGSALFSKADWILFSSFLRVEGRGGEHRTLNAQHRTSNIEHLTSKEQDSAWRGVCPEIGGPGFQRESGGVEVERTFIERSESLAMLRFLLRQSLWFFEIQVDAKFFESLLFDAGDAHEIFRFFEGSVFTGFDDTVGHFLTDSRELHQFIFSGFVGIDF